jgi:hypothetical protein
MPGPSSLTANSTSVACDLPSNRGAETKLKIESTAYARSSEAYPTKKERGTDR